MNHYLLPHNKGDVMNTRYGDDALPRLLKQLHIRGVERGRLVAKVYGGAQMLSNEADIGQMNIEFAERFLRESNIPIVDSDLGGASARWIDFHPTSGRTFIRTARKEAASARDGLPAAGEAGFGALAARGFRAES
jgi:chemotaxis protein CheD